jgi:phosphonate transport system permease protein
MAAEPVSEAPEAVNRDRLLSPWPRLTVGRAIGVVVVFAVFAWALTGTDVRPAALIEGLPAAADFLSRLLPPEWKTEPVTVGVTGWVIAVPEVAFAIAETVQMALIGTTVAVVLAVPFGLLAARNTSPHRVVYQGTRIVLNIIRAVPDIIYGLMFVAAVGLGPFSGVLALSFGAIGSMGKLYAEAIEAIDPQQVMAVTATGASRAHAFIYGVMPQALPLVASYALLLFETNIRSASVLGIVGAGGVGFVLTKYMALFQYHYLVGALILIVVAVTTLDRLSDAVRKRLT